MGIQIQGVDHISATNVDVSELSPATYDDLQDFINQFGNRTHISGMLISDALDGTANISAGTGWCKISNSLNAEGKFFDFAGGASDDVSGALTDLAVNYIYLDYNAGTPQIVHDTTGSLFYTYDHIVLGCVYRHGTHLHLINSNYAGLDAAHMTKMRIYEKLGAGDRTSGLVTTGTGTRQLAITAGVIWTGLTRTVALSFDTSSVGSGTADATEANKLHDADGGFTANDVGKTVKNTTDTTYTHVTAYVDSGELTLEDDIFVNGETYQIYDSWEYWYYDGDLGTPAWVRVEHSTQIDDTQYNAVATGLATLTANRYAVHWVYLDAEGKHLHIVYGQGDYTASQAELATVPASLPPVVANFSSIIAKIIKQKSSGTLTITYPWTTVFLSSLATDHGSQAGLLDDDHTQYIRHALATAANDFLVASGSGVYVKKTLAEVKTIIGQQSKARAYPSADQGIHESHYTHIILDIEDFDEQNEFATSIASSIATANTAGVELWDSTNPFVAGDVGKIVWNINAADTGLGKSTTIAAYVGAGHVTLTADIEIDDGDDYRFGVSRFTATVAGYYAIPYSGTLINLGDGKKIIVFVQKNGAGAGYSRTTVGGTDYVAMGGTQVLYLAANDYIELVMYHNNATALDTAGQSVATNLGFHRLS